MHSFPAENQSRRCKVFRNESSAKGHITAETQTRVAHRPLFHTFSWHCPLVPVNSYNIAFCRTSVQLEAKTAAPMQLCLRVSQVCSITLCYLFSFVQLSLSDLLLSIYNKFSFTDCSSTWSWSTPFITHIFSFWSHCNQMLIFLTHEFLYISELVKRETW